MRSRGPLRWYHLTSRAWMTLAPFTLLLSPARRAVFWLPLHLALAGAVAVAISGSMQTFASALTAAPEAPRALALPQLILVNLGVPLIALGFTREAPLSLVATGGALFATAMVLLAAIVARAWRRGINRRFTVVLGFYAAALVSILAGATLGAVLGMGAIHDGLTYLAVRDAHMILNVLGFVTPTIAGTLVTFLPTVLRVRIPAWNHASAAVGLVAGAWVLALGRGLQARALAVAGASLLVIGAAAMTWPAIAALRTQRRHFTPTAARHLACAIAWFDAGAVRLLVQVALGRVLGPGFYVMFVLGWIVQTLLGAWLYLLPAQRAGNPAERKLLLAGVELGGWVEVVALNAGLLMLVFAVSAGRGLTLVGAALALLGGSMALTKAWAFAPLARLGATRRLSERLWAEPRT